jgi:hypothetical protein
MTEITDPGGLQTDRYEESRAKIVESWKDKFGPDANTASDTPDGHIIDWGTQMVQTVNEQQASAYQAQFLTTVRNVNGAAQIIGPLFGTQPQQATGSTGEILAFGDVGTAIGQGSVCSTAQSGARFSTDQTLAIEQSIWLAFRFGPAVQSTAVEIVIGPEDYGPSFGIVGTGLEVAQTAQGLFIPDPQVATIYDAYEDANGLGVLILETTGIYSAAVSATNSDSEFWRGSLMPVTSEELAPIEAGALTITRVNTPAPNDGWKGCANLASVTVGSNADSLAQYIQRHLDTLGKNGTSTLVGLLGRLRDTDVNPGNEYVEIYNNPTGETVDGRPLKSFEVVYRGGSGQTVAEIIWENHPLGIQSVGEQEYTINDPRTSQPHSVYATLAHDLFAWCDVSITPGEGFPSTPVSDLQVQVANAIVAFGETRGVGLDAYVKDYATAMGLTGVEDCTISFGVTNSAVAPKPPLSPSNLIVADSDILLWDTVRVEVVINE